MSAVREKITEEIKLAMKAKDTARLGTLRLVKAEIIKKETEKDGSDLDDDGFIRLLQSMKKQREDSFQAFEKGGRQELADKEKAEIVVLEAFMPQQLSDEELTAMAVAVVTELGVSDMKQMGGAIKELMSRAAGRADGKRVSAAVKAQL